VPIIACVTDAPEETQGLLRQDVAVIREYGSSRTDEWVELWFENEPTVRLVTAFSANVAHHEAELRRLVAHPERLDVRSMPWSRRTLQDILAQIHDMATTDGQGAFLRWGSGTGRVHVTVRPDRQTLAADLKDRFGDAIVLTVGLLPYPPGRPLVERERLHRPTALPTSVDVEGLHPQLVLSTPRLAPGQDGRGRLVVRNTGSALILRSTDQPLSGRILDRRTGDVVGGGAGAIAGTGRSIRLQPGEQDTIELRFGTSSYLPALGYALPPGGYHVQAVFAVSSDLQGQMTEHRGRPRQFVSVPPAELTIAAD
jgi:hypothetical protein